MSTWARSTRMDFSFNHRETHTYHILSWNLCSMFLTVFPLLSPVDLRLGLLPYKLLTGILVSQKCIKNALYISRQRNSP